MIVFSLMLLYLPISTRPLGRGMDAGSWYRAVVVSLFTGAIGSYVSVVSLALPGFLSALGAERLARVCDELLGHLPHGGSFVGWIASVATLLMTAVAVRARHRTSRALENLRVEPGVGRHLALQGFELVVLPTHEQLAYSRQEEPGQIVVSAGTIDVLSDVELDVLIGRPL